MCVDSRIVFAFFFEISEEIANEHHVDRIEPGLRLV